MRSRFVAIRIELPTRPPQSTFNPIGKDMNQIDRWRVMSTVVSRGGLKSIAAVRWFHGIDFWASEASKKPFRTSEIFLHGIIIRRKTETCACIHASISRRFRGYGDAYNKYRTLFVVLRDLYFSDIRMIFSGKSLILAWKLLHSHLPSIMIFRIQSVFNGTGPI